MQNSILISTFFLSLLSNYLWASQDAVIKPEKAIVYADSQLTSPIGFIRRGTEVIVGDKLLKNGSLLRIIVSGKIAFIKVNDLYLLKDLPNKEFGGYRKSRRKGVH